MKKANLFKIKEITERYYKGRKIVIWGAGRNGLPVKECLEETLDSVDFFVDKDEQKVNNTTVFTVDKLSGKAFEYYVCVSVSDFHEEIEQALLDMGYNKNYDFCYLPEFVKMVMDYTDCFGNRIIGSLKGAQVVFQGSNSTIEIGENVTAHNVYIYVGSNCKIKIGDDVGINRVRYENHTRWFFRDNCVFEIDNGSVFWGYGFLNCLKNSYMKIGSKVTIQFNYIMCICENTEALIGDNCMISYDFAMFTNDAHPIWDLDTKELLNDSNKKKYRVEFEPHVWIGFRVTVLKNSYIGCGTVVGSNSVINKKYPNNCCVAGNPARIVRKNIAWNQKGTLEDINEDYLNFTEGLNDE